MRELHALEAVRGFRELAKFYGEAAKLVTAEASRSHYLRLLQVCEAQAYELEISVVGAPEVCGGTIRSGVALNG